MSNKISKEPLVSVCIITYNSSDFIIEALDSVVDQTYRNVELIISDDSSNDRTVDICHQWLLSNSKRFVNSEIVTIDNNTGTSANCNRAVKHSHGSWIKILAGDDKLLPNCIEDNIDFINNHPKTELLFSDMRVVGPNELGEKILSRSLFFDKLRLPEFKTYFFCHNFLPAPSSFVSRNLYDALGGFDEKIPFMEDKPFYLRAIWDNHIPLYMKKTTVCYRIHSESMSFGTNLKSKYLDSCKLLNAWVLDYLHKEYPALWFYRRNFEAYQDNPTTVNLMLHLLRFVNPAYYFYKYISYKVRFYLHFS